MFHCSFACGSCAQYLVSPFAILPNQQGDSSNSLLYCATCAALRCSYCVNSSIDGVYCPSCLDIQSDPSTSCRRCMKCPQCQHPLSTRTADKLLYFFCQNCKWDSSEKQIVGESLVKLLIPLLPKDKILTFPDTNANEEDDKEVYDIVDKVPESKYASEGEEFFYQDRTAMYQRKRTQPSVLSMRPMISKQCNTCASDLISYKNSASYSVGCFQNRSVAAFVLELKISLLTARALLPEIKLTKSTSGTSLRLSFLFTKPTVVRLFDESTEIPLQKVSSDVYSTELPSIEDGTIMRLELQGEKGNLNCQVRLS